MSTAVATRTHPPDTDPNEGRFFLADVAHIVGVDPETADKFRGVSLAEGGAGPRGLPVPDGYIPGRGRYQRRPWWKLDTLVRWAISVGLIHPFTREPQRMAQSNAPHPRRPTVKAPRPARFRRLVDDDTPWYLADIARESGYPLATVKRKFRHVSLIEGGMGPHGMPMPVDYDPPWPGSSLPRPYFLAGPVRWWLIATGRMNPYTGAPQRMAQTFAMHPWRPTVRAPDRLA